MTRTLLLPNFKNHPHLPIWLFAGLMAQCLCLVTQGYSATFRCYDEARAQVLTDNPAQLFDCTILQSQISSGINEASPASPMQNRDSGGVPPAEPHDTPTIDDRLQEESNQDEQSGEEITVPLTKIAGSLVVRVLLNQERWAHLIVDTGASMTVLSTDAALDLGILGTTDNELLTVNTAGGSVQVNMNYLSSLSVGSAQATNVAVAIHDLPDVPEHIEGLLGMSFLKHFLVTLDSEHDQLMLRPKRHP